MEKEITLEKEKTCEGLIKILQKKEENESRKKEMIFIFYV